MSVTTERPLEIVRYQRYCELLRRALEETDDVTEAMLAAELALSMDSSGVALGMVGDEWEGQESPGKGWYLHRVGPHGGKYWRKSGSDKSASSASSKYSPPTQSILKSLAQGNAAQAVKIYRSLTPEWKKKAVEELPAQAKKAMNEASKKALAVKRILPTDEELSKAVPNPSPTNSQHKNDIGSVKVGGKNYFYKVALAEAAVESEVISSQLAAIAGVSVPATRKASPSWAHGTVGIVSDLVVGKAIVDIDPDMTFEQLTARVPEEEVWKHIYFGYLADLGDSHLGNYMIGGNKLHRVDNEYSFRDSPKPPTTMSVLLNGLFLSKGEDAVYTPDKVRIDQRAAAAMGAKAEKMAAHLEETYKGEKKDKIDWLRKRGAVLRDFSRSGDPTFRSLQTIHNRYFPSR